MSKELADRLDNMTLFNDSDRPIIDEVIAALHSEPSMCPENSQPCECECTGGWCRTMFGTPESPLRESRTDRQEPGLSADEMLGDEFDAWWKREGRLIRAGGGDYERSFAWGAWKDAMALRSLTATTVSEQYADDLLRSMRVRIASLTDEMLSPEYKLHLRNEILVELDAYLARKEQ